MDRGRTAARLLLDTAGPRLYRDNPFRITGLATGVTTRQVRQRRALVLDAFDLGMGAPAEQRLPLPEPPTEAEVRAAFDTLARPDQRLVHELFWWWGEPDGCGCDLAVHLAHDRAVEGHARALDLTLAHASGSSARGVRERFDRWADTAHAWAEALVEEDAFWAHVRYRVGALADRRLDETTIDGLREAMPRALLTPQAALARSEPAHAGLSGLLDEWSVPAEVVDDAREFAAEPTYERITATLDAISGLIDRDEGQEAVRRSRAELPMAAALLETLAPHARHRRSARIRNRIAVIMNNSALAIPHSPTNTPLRVELFEAALELVVTSEDREILTGNLATDLAEASKLPPFERDFQAVAQLRRQGKHGAAKILLKRIGERTYDPAVWARVQAGLRYPVPRVWPASLAVILAYYAASMWLLLPLWKNFVMVLVTMAAPIVPCVIVCSRGFRRRAGRHPRLSMLAFFRPSGVATTPLVRSPLFSFLFAAVSMGGLELTLPIGFWIAEHLPDRRRY
jgi:hypothetical protein